MILKQEASGEILHRLHRHMCFSVVIKKFDLQTDVIWKAEVVEEDWSTVQRRMVQPVSLIQS